MRCSLRCVSLTSLILYSIILTEDLKAARRNTAVEPELCVHVYDYAAVPSEILAAGEEKSSELFRAGRIHLIWVKCRLSGDGGNTQEVTAGARQPQILKILPEIRVGPLDPDQRALGLTIPGTSYVFYDRVRVASPVLPISVVLGYVFAHELGHLLGLHHSVGLMSESLPRAWLTSGGGRFGFTGQQVDAMERKLMDPPGAQRECGLSCRVMQSPDAIPVEKTPVPLRTDPPASRSSEYVESRWATRAVSSRARTLHE